MSSAKKKTAARGLFYIKNIKIFPFYIDNEQKKRYNIN